MSKEKIVKKQAREAMKGNTLPIISGIALCSLIYVLLQNVMYVIMLAFNAINIDTEDMEAGKELPFFLTFAGVVIVGVLLSPFFNGMYKAAANAVINKNNEVTDLLYFFKGGRRYLKTLLVNMALVLIYGAATTLFSGVVKLLLVDGLGMKDGSVTHILGMSLKSSDVTSFIVGLISAVFAFFVYALFLHYPLCLYAIDDSGSAARYMFGYIGFSFRHFGAFFKLFFSMIGWILLCFFIVPVIYVGPYALCAAINSTRWLKKSDDDKAAKKYAPQQFSQDTQNNNIGDSIVW